jgi:hypothetical protein
MVVAWWASGLVDSGVGMVVCLFFQCIVVWRKLPRARGSGCQSFRSPFSFTSAKSVSSISARSLIHGAHAVCVCVPVAILDSFWLFSIGIVLSKLIVAALVIKEVTM